MVRDVFEEELDGELISEENVESAAPGGDVRALPREYENRSLVPALRSEEE